MLENNPASVVNEGTPLVPQAQAQDVNRILAIYEQIIAFLASSDPVRYLAFRRFLKKHLAVTQADVYEQVIADVETIHRTNTFYKREGFIKGIQHVIETLWPIVFTSLTAHDLILYAKNYNSCDENRLKDMALFSSVNSESLTSSVPDTFYAPIILGLAPLLFGAIHWLDRYTHTMSEEAGNHFSPGESAQAIAPIELPQQSWPALIGSFLPASLSFNHFRTQLGKIEMLLMQPELTTEHFESLAQALGLDIHQRKALEKIVIFETIKRVLASETNGMDTLVNVGGTQSSRKELLLQIIQECAESSDREPFLVRLSAKNKLWELGEFSQLNQNSWQRVFLEALFSLKLGYEAYCKTAYYVFLGYYVVSSINNYVKDKQCEKEHKVRTYMPQVGEKQCTPCGDWDVPYKWMHSGQNCLTAYLAIPRTSTQLIDAFSRVAHHGPIQTVDLSQQDWTGFSHADMARLFRAIQSCTKELKTLNLSAVHCVSTEITEEQADSLMRFFQKVSIEQVDFTGLDLSNQAVATKVLCPELSASVKHLNTSFTLCNVDVLTQITANFTQLESLNISYNGYVDADMQQLMPRLKVHAKALEEMDFSGNVFKQAGLNACGENLPNNVTKVNCNYMLWAGIDFSVFGEALQSHSLISLTVKYSGLDDDAFATLYPYLSGSSIQIFDVSGNKLTYLSILGWYPSLPSTNITELSLAENNIGNYGLYYLTQGLLGSGIRVLNLNDVRMTKLGLDYLNQTIAAHPLFGLDISNNEINDQESLEHLLKTLSNSPIQSFSMNEIQLYDMRFNSTLADFLQGTNKTLVNLELNQVNLLPSAWAEVFDKLQEQKSVLQSLSATKIILQDEGFCAMMAWLANSNVVALSLPSTRLTDAALQCFAENMPKLSSLQSVDLSSNPFSKAGTEPFAASLITPGKYDQCLIKPNKYVRQAIAGAEPASQLQRLSMASCGLTQDGFEPLARVSASAALDFLVSDFSHNPIVGANPNTALVSASGRLEPPQIFIMMYKADSCIREYLREQGRLGLTIGYTEGKPWFESVKSFIRNSASEAMQPDMKSRYMIAVLLAYRYELFSMLPAAMQHWVTSACSEDLTKLCNELLDYGYQVQEDFAPRLTYKTTQAFLSEKKDGKAAVKAVAVAAVKTSAIELGKSAMIKGASFFQLPSMVSSALPWSMALLPLVFDYSNVSRRVGNAYQAGWASLAFALVEEVARTAPGASLFEDSFTKDGDSCRPSPTHS